MQQVRKKIPTPAQLLTFPNMGMTPDKPLPTLVPATPTWWQQHGTTAQWATLVVAFLALLLGPATAIYFHVSDGNAKATEAAATAQDNHTGELIDKKLNPAIVGINEHTDLKVGELEAKIGVLSEKVANLYGLDGKVAKLETRADRETSLAKVGNPSRVLALVRTEIQVAKDSGKTLPQSDLIDYKNVVLELPTSAIEYWTTVAAIINYQSKLNQQIGQAPNPREVSRPCFGATEGMGSNNTFQYLTMSNCIIDLDTTKDTFDHITFKDSVIRYAGGPVHLINVNFVNCYFQINVKSHTAPAKPTFLLALLGSPKQTSVTVR